ncbi:MAG: trigger factor, partial [Thermoleophilaceae bacterium]|nr:trigger factor [Thermoleophilaceae bacterium]
ERFASLESVERPAQNGDFVQLDFLGRIDDVAFEGGAAKDFVLELGSNQFIEGFEEQLVGTKAGDELDVNVSFPDDYGKEELAGKPAVFEVKVHEIKEKRLGELTDEFAQEHLGYDTAKELLDEIELRINQQAEEQVEREYRWAVVDAVAAKAEMTIPHDHIHSRAHELWHDMSQSLAQRGIDPRAYVQAMGKTEHEFITDAEGDAEKTIRREAALAAVIEQETFEITEEDLIDALTEGDESQNGAAIEHIAKIRDAGNEAQFKRDVVSKLAVDFLVGKAKPIAKDLADARDAIWTPEKEAEQAGAAGGQGAEIWTPGS